MPGGVGSAVLGDGDCGGGVVVTAGLAEILGLMCGTLGDVVGGLALTVTLVGVMTGGGRIGDAELADAADADCWATWALTTFWVMTRFWLPLTSRPTRSTAVSVTAVITTQESNHPSASVSGRPARRRPPSMGSQNRRRGDSLRLGSRRRETSWSGSCSSDTSSFSAVWGRCGVKPSSRWCGNLGTAVPVHPRY